MASRIKTEVKVDKHSTTAIGAVKKPWEGFMQFLGRYAILSMAIGIVIGQTVKDTVDTLVTGLITPLISLITPSVELQDLVVNVGKAEFQIGAVLNALLQMFIIVGLVYLVIGVLLRRQDILDEAKPKKKTASKGTGKKKTDEKK